MEGLFLLRQLGGEVECARNEGVSMETTKGALGRNKYTNKKITPPIHDKYLLTK